jgi:hypothetical protein
MLKVVLTTTTLKHLREDKPALGVVSHTMILLHSRRVGDSNLVADSLQSPSDPSDKPSIILEAISELCSL